MAAVGDIESWGTSSGCTTLARELAARTKEELIGAVPSTGAKRVKNKFGETSSSTFTMSVTPIGLRLP